MSRQIDLTKPLSDEDRAYLEARVRTNDLALNQQYLSGEEPVGESGFPPVTDSPSTAPVSPDATPAEAGAQTPAEPPQGTVPAADTGDASADGSAEAADADDNYDDESVWSYDDLKAEAKQANETLGEDDRIALNLSRADLVAALRHYDATYDADSSDD